MRQLWRLAIVASVVVAAPPAGATVGRWKSEAFVVDLASGAIQPVDEPPREAAPLASTCGGFQSRISTAGSKLVVEDFVAGRWTPRASVESTLAPGDAIHWHALMQDRLVVANEVHARRYELDIHAFDVSSGREVWHASTRRHDVTCTDLGHGVIGLDLEDGLRAFDLETGRVRFTIPTPAAARIQVTSLGEDRWLAVGDRAMAVFEANRGAIAWRRAVTGAEVKRTLVLGRSLVVAFRRPAGPRAAKIELVPYDLRRGTIARRASLASAAWDLSWTEVDDLRPNPDAPTQVLVTVGTYGPVGP